MVTHLIRSPFRDHSFPESELGESISIHFYSINPIFLRHPQLPGLHRFEFRVFRARCIVRHEVLRKNVSGIYIVKSNVFGHCFETVPMGLMGEYISKHTEDKSLPVGTNFCRSLSFVLCWFIFSRFSFSSSRWVIAIVLNPRKLVLANSIMVSLLNQTPSAKRAAGRSFLSWLLKSETDLITSREVLTFGSSMTALPIFSNKSIFTESLTSFSKSGVQNGSPEALSIRIGSLKSGHRLSFRTPQSFRNLSTWRFCDRGECWSFTGVIWPHW